jgi:ribosylpyrimidine nucleosidase
MINKMPLILDCDPGHDDAVALLLAGRNPAIDLLGVSVVSGNQTIEKTTVNALSICQYLGINVPVAMGAEKPLKKPAMICPEIHGASGLDGVTFPPLTKKLDPRQGYQLIIDLCLAHQGVILVPTGPLTNIALALQHEPKIKDHIAKIVLMGGSMGFGNVTPAAEFNILVDPEAAEIVFASGLPIYMNGLDVTREVLVHHSIIERMNQMDNKASRFFHDLMMTFNANQKKVFGWPDGGPLHDPVTIVSLLNPKCVTYQAMNVTIDVSGGPSYGRTNCDRYDYLHLPKNAFVATAIDVPAYWDVVEKGLRLYS